MEAAGITTNVLSWVFTTISIILVSLRLLARFRLSDKRGWDDLWLINALVLVVFDSAFTSYAVSQGLGKHMADFESPQSISNALKWSVAADTIGIYCFTAPKLAIAVLLARILEVGGTTSRVHKILLYTPAALMVCLSTVLLGMWLGQCQPTAGLWDKSVNAKCWNVNVYDYAAITVCSISAAIDFYYGIYPVIFISKLNMDLRRKIHLSVMLGLGIVGGAVAIWKTTKIPGITATGADVTYGSAILIYATNIESNCLIFAACIPALGPVVSAVNKKIPSIITPRGSRATKSYHQFDTPNITGSDKDNLVQLKGDALLREGQTRAFAHGSRTHWESHELRNFSGDSDVDSIERGMRSHPTDGIAARTVIDIEMSGK